MKYLALIPLLVVMGCQREIVVPKNCHIQDSGAIVCDGKWPTARNCPPDKDGNRICDNHFEQVGPAKSPR